MKIEFDDNTKARIKEILRAIRNNAKTLAKNFFGRAKNRLRIAGPPVLAWILKHKAPIAIILLVLYILFVPRHVPERKLADAQPPAATATSPNAAPPTTQATTEPVAPQSVGDIQLYAPERAGFDQQWGLPANLKSADLQNFAHQVEKLAVDTQQTITLETQYNTLLTNLIDDRIATLYWQRLLGRGFRDTSLPLDWYEVVKDRNGILASVAAIGEMMTNASAQTVIIARLCTVRVRIVGSKVIVGDQLFVKGLQQYINQRLGYLRTAVPQAQGVATRTGKEFQGELNQNQN